MLGTKPKMDATLSNSKIDAAFRNRTTASSKLAAEAREVLPSGIAHDSRYLKPYGVYIERARGSRKWDVDGNEYIDYFGGHGSLLLGHCHPAVLAATHAALEESTQFGANHPREVRWGQWVQRLIPSAERVRFTASGTEADLMAVRLARAFTGKSKLVRFMTHYHGWSDHMTPGYANHFDGTPTTGVLKGVSDNVLLLPQGDVTAMREALAADKDIAAVILEPTGSAFGTAPLVPSFLSALREETQKHDIILIFDEVVTGFRVSPGGAQAHFGVTPDLTTLAKILAGGFPGGAVCGRREILDELDFEATARKKREKIKHQGTFNANPFSAAAGIAALELVGTTDACARANSTGETLRIRFNEVLASEGVPWSVYGTFSSFKFFLNPRSRSIEPSKFDPLSMDYKEILEQPEALARKFRLALLVNGVDVNGKLGGIISAVHGQEDVDQTVDAVRESIRMLKAEGELSYTSHT
jgi:glutamate-1-semialdehyde 2,1-aminomutase